MAIEIWVNIGSGNGLLPDGQTITWTNVDLSPIRYTDIHLRAISQEITQPIITKIILKITHLKCSQNLQGANELNDKVPYFKLMKCYPHPPTSHQTYDKSIQQYPCISNDI